MPTTGPVFATRKPRFNHVAMSLTPEMLDEEHRKLRADFFGDVFGFVDLPMMTIDRKRQVFQVHNIEQFVFLIADDPHMSGPRMDHFGMGVDTMDELDAFLARAQTYREKDDRVDLIDKHADEYPGVTLTSFYVRYLLPLMVEVQHYAWHEV